MHAVRLPHSPTCALLLIAFAATPGRGTAQETTGILQSASAPEVRSDEAGLKDRSRARLLSTTATLVPLALAGTVATVPRGRSQPRDLVSGVPAAAGLLAGPSAGSIIYAYDGSWARRGMLVRTGGRNAGARGGHRSGRLGLRWRRRWDGRGGVPRLRKWGGGRGCVGSLQHRALVGPLGGGAQRGGAGLPGGVPRPVDAPGRRHGSAGTHLVLSRRGQRGIPRDQEPSTQSQASSS